MSCDVSCRVLITTATITWVIIGVLFIVYYWRKFHLISNNLILKKRYIFLVYLEFALVITFLLFERGVYAIDVSIQINHYPVWYAVLDYFSTIVYPPAFHGIFFVIILRIWHMYYDLNFYKISSSTTSIAWKSIINPSINVNNNWFIKNKSKYGNYLFTFKYILVPIWIFDALVGWFIYISIKPQVHLLPSHYVLITDIPNQIISNAIIWIFYCKVPTSYDTIFMRLELKYTVIFYSIFTLSRYIVAGLARMVFSADLYGQTILSIIFQVGTITAVISPTLIIIPYQIRKQIVCRIASRSEIALSIRSSHSVLSQSSPSPSDGNSGTERDCDIEIVFDDNEEKEKHVQQERKKKNSVELFKLFKYQQSFEQFMIHLQRELSSECLLSFCELLQFRMLICDIINKYYPNQLGDNNMNTDDFVRFMNCFYGDFPKSEIVHSNVGDIESEVITLLACKQKYNLLFERYIKIGSELEINLNYETKKRLYAMMEGIKLHNVNIRLSDLRDVFNDVIIEVYMLMIDPFARFRCTEQYQQIYLDLFVNE